jgi:hypothetical protein
LCARRLADVSTAPPSSSLSDRAVVKSGCSFQLLLPASRSEALGFRPGSGSFESTLFMLVDGAGAGRARTLRYTRSPTGPATVACLLGARCGTSGRHRTRRLRCCCTSRPALRPVPRQHSPVQVPLSCANSRAVDGRLCAGDPHRMRSRGTRRTHSRARTTRTACAHAARLAQAPSAAPAHPLAPCAYSVWVGFSGNSLVWSFPANEPPLLVCFAVFLKFFKLVLGCSQHQEKTIFSLSVVAASGLKYFPRLGTKYTL